MVKIIIVEDDYYIRNFLKNNIPWNSHGFEVVGEAPDGGRALAVIKKTQPEIIITDIVMPNMNGVELIKRLKEERNPAKLVVLSSYNDFEYVKESMKLGAVEYILKHMINPDEIIQLMVKISREIEDERENEERIKKAITAYENNYSGII